MKVHHRPSPNWNARKAGNGPELIVLHGTAGRSDEGDLSWLCDPASRVSYHYLIGRDGRIWQLVAEKNRAWHAGRSVYQGRTDAGGASVNGISIGVAFSNRGPSPTPEPYTDAQYDAGAWLCSNIWERRGVDISRITTHAVVSPGRKTDPWDHFNLGRFFRQVADYRYPPPPPIDLKVAA